MIFLKSYPKKIKTLLKFIFIQIIFVSCAQIVPLSGGKTDTDSPKLISSFPNQASLQFNGNKVELIFDELIKLNSASTIIITPSLSEQPEININGNKLSLIFNEKLKENTTYYIYFGNSIADITENNLTDNLQLFFSTGNNIDSAFVKGRIIYADDLKPISNATIGLYSGTKDSIAFFEKPVYTTLSNSLGEFKIPYVKKGNYQLIGIEDQNKNKVYDIGEKIAFNSNELILDSNQYISLTAFKEESDKLFFKKITSLSPEKFLIVLNKNIDKLENFSIMNSKKESFSNFNIYHKNNTDSIFIFIKNNERDTLYFKLKGISDEAKLISQSKAELQTIFKKGRYPFELKALLVENNSFPYFKKIKFHSNFLISEVNYSKISIQSEDKNVNFSEQDLTHTLDSVFINFKWKEQTSYEIIFYPGAVKDFFDRTNDTLKISFKTNGIEDYGTLTINFNKCITNKILQLIGSKNNCVFEKNIKDVEKLKINQLLPDNYTIRIISDLNADNKFTTGCYTKKILPENIKINKEIVKILAGWENELNLQDDFINENN